MQDFIGDNKVISKARLAELSVRSDGPALKRLAMHWGAIGLTAYLMHLTAGHWLCIPLFIFQGVLINNLYAPEHECDHFTAFKTRSLNIWVARICGFAILFNNAHHRSTHYHHHRNTQDWDEDPEIRERDRLDSVWAYLVALAGIKNIWTGRLVPLFHHTLGVVHEPYLSASQKQSIIATARGYALGYAAILISALVFQSWWPVYYWLGPFVAMRWAYWLQGLGEHTGLTHEPYTLLNTRTLKANRFMCWVNWNMAYHTVHHTFPGVPFYRLPELHAEVETNLGFELPSDSYFRLHWQHLKRLFNGETETDICNAHTEELRALKRL
ncbi:MAG: fatty acid desaturase [Pseudomonadota bacterium]